MNKSPERYFAAYKRHKRKLVYISVGALLFAIDFTTTVAVYHILHIAPGYASACGFLTSFIVGFTLNKRVVFKHSSTSKFSLPKQVTLYLLLAVTNLFVTSSLVGFFVGKGFRIEIVKAAVVIAAACWNYVILGNYVFAHKNQSSPVLP